MKNYRIFSVLCMLIMAVGCVEPLKWTHQHNYRYYECFPESGVKSVTTTFYNPNGKKIRVAGLNFSANGDLLKESLIEGDDTSLVASYEYDRGRLTDILISDGTESKLRYDNDGFLVGIEYYIDWQGEKTLSKSFEVTYTEDGLVSTFKFVKEPVGYLPGGEEEEMGCSGEYQIEYVNGLRSSFISLYYNNNTGENQRFEYTYNDKGYAEGLTVFDANTEKKLRTITYSYKYDDRNNWIERRSKVKGRTVEVEKREIEYYAPEELAAVVADKKAQKSYFDGLKERLELMIWQYDGGVVLMIVVLLLALGALIFSILTFLPTAPFSKQQTSKGMYRLWMYNAAPYLNVLTYIGVAFLCLIAAILIITIVGGVFWLLAWILKIIFLIIIFLGWVMAIGGGLAVLGGGCVGVIPLVIGILIVSNRVTMKAWGEAAVNWSFDFLQRINMIGWGFNFIVNLWDGILLVFLTPLVVFLIIASLIIVLNTLLIGFEWIVTRIYGIRRPCPSCGNTKAMDYIIAGKVHPVGLHPGTYGVFSQVSPVTGKKIPTMLLNGKGKLDRKCPHCGTIIHADAEKAFGTDVHIGFVGHRSSGKSYMLYSGLYQLKKEFSDRIAQIDSDQETKIESKKQRIDARQGIQTRVENKYRAVQLMLSSKSRPVPYHLFFYDVAGEKFDTSSESYRTAMEFYKNVQSIVYVIDPSMIDYLGTSASQNVREWAARPEINSGEVYRPSLSVLKAILEGVGRKPKDIDLTFVCAKADKGYFEADGVSREGLSEMKIKEFICTSLGLGNLVHSAENDFNSVRYFEVSVTDGNDKKLRNLFDTLLKQRGVKA